jgi:hypothetical protein
VKDSRGVIEAVERVLNRGGDADDVLRSVVTILHERGRYRWAAVTFLEDGQEVEGPMAGEPEAGASFPVSFNGQLVAHLHVAGADDDRELLERVAKIISPYALVGWDTGGEEWVP